MDKRKVRVRFAPSPTGPLHIGGVRTALYNYLFAKQHQGNFILRIEDTDRTRFVEGAEIYILESLAWCGIQIDEGVIEGGKYGPYRQSERKDIYRKYAEQLINDGTAYYAFDTAEELNIMRETLKKEKASNLSYSYAIRDKMKNSLNMSADELNIRLESEEPYAIRIKIPVNETIFVHDLIRGEVRVHTSELDDKVLYKSDGMPTYHLANVVDDYLMDISHVVRGEEWLPSAPLHVLLYKYLGWTEVMPQFAHLPLLLKPDGNGKLSKRDGDRLGFPVFPLNWKDPVSQEIFSGYREAGYLPEAFVNILAFLGWNPGTEKEIFSMEELIHEFSLERVGKAGAKFDPEKAKWFNQETIKNTDNNKLAELVKAIIISRGHKYDVDYVSHVWRLLKERVTLIPDFWATACYFFEAPGSYEEKIIQKKWKTNTNDLIEQLTNRFVKLKDFDAAILENTFKEFLLEKELSIGVVLFPLRYIISGVTSGPSVFDILSLIGKEESLNRIRNFLLQFPSNN